MKIFKKAELKQFGFVISHLISKSSIISLKIQLVQLFSQDKNWYNEGLRTYGRFEYVTYLRIEYQIQFHIYQFTH